MRKLLLGLFSISILLGACKKDSSTSSSSNSFKFDFRGATQNFSSVSSAKDSVLSTYKQFEIEGMIPASPIANTVSFAILHPTSTNFLGTHNDLTSFPGSFIRLNAFINGKRYTNSAYADNSYADYLPAIFTAVVTKDANKNLIGTFTGEVYEINPTTGVAVTKTKYNITNGSFNVVIQ